MLEETPFHRVARQLERGGKVQARSFILPTAKLKFAERGVHRERRLALIANESVNEHFKSIAEDFCCR